MDITNYNFDNFTIVVHILKKIHFNSDICDKIPPIGYIELKTDNELINLLIKNGTIKWDYNGSNENRFTEISNIENNINFYQKNGIELILGDLTIKIINDRFILVIASTILLDIKYNNEEIDDCISKYLEYELAFLSSTVKYLDNLTIIKNNIKSYSILHNKSGTIVIYNLSTHLSIENMINCYIKFMEIVERVKNIKLFTEIYHIDNILSVVDFCVNPIENNYNFEYRRYVVTSNITYRFYKCQDLMLYLEKGDDSKLEIVNKGKSAN